jgi:hypothetical protein
MFLVGVANNLATHLPTGSRLVTTDASRYSTILCWRIATESIESRIFQVRFTRSPEESPQNRNLAKLRLYVPMTQATVMLLGYPNTCLNC